MIKSATLNELMLEKTALDWNDAKSFGKEVYRGGKRTVNLMKDVTMEAADDYLGGTSVLDKVPALKKRVRDEYSDAELEFKNTRAQKNMDRIAKQHGYAYQGDNTWHNPKTGKTFKLNNVHNGISNTSMTGPHMMPGGFGNGVNAALDKFEQASRKAGLNVRLNKLRIDTRGVPDVDTISIGKRGNLRNKGVLAHEFGHHLQSPTMRRIHTAAQLTGKVSPVLAGINTVVGPFTYGLPATIAINKGLAGATAAAGATVAGSELQASYLGTKHLGGRVKHRARAFAGVPTYLANAVASPLNQRAESKNLLKNVAKLKFKFK